MKIGDDNWTESQLAKVGLMRRAYEGKIEALERALGAWTGASAPGAPTISTTVLERRLFRRRKVRVAYHASLLDALQEPGASQVYMGGRLMLAKINGRWKAAP
jgi:hypothetical protein